MSFSRRQVLAAFGLAAVSTVLPKRVAPPSRALMTRDGVLIEPGTTFLWK